MLSVVITWAQCIWCLWGSWCVRHWSRIFTGVGKAYAPVLAIFQYAPWHRIVYLGAICVGNIRVGEGKATISFVSCHWNEPFSPCNISITLLGFFFPHSRSLNTALAIVKYAFEHFQLNITSMVISDCADGCSCGEWGCKTTISLVLIFFKYGQIFWHKVSTWT